MRTASGGNMTPEELLYKKMMETVMANAKLITMKTDEDDGIERRIFPGS
nr:MAG TPA: hypothetical protein [Caudoviricetes sp.]